MQTELHTRERSLSIKILICISLLTVIGIAGTVSADCGGSSESDFGSDNYMSNWQSVSDTGLDAQIAQQTATVNQLKTDLTAFEKTLQDKTVNNQIVYEKLLIGNLNFEKAALETALQDKTLDDKTVQDKTTQLAAVNNKITAETAKLGTLMQDPTINTPALQEKTTQLTTLQDKISKETTTLNNLAQEKSVQSSMYQVAMPTSGGAGISGLKVKFSKALKSAPTAGVLAYTVSPYNAENMLEQKTAIKKAMAQTQLQYSPKEQLKVCNERLGAYMCTKGTKSAF